MVQVQHVIQIGIVEIPEQITALYQLLKKEKMELKIEKSYSEQNRFVSIEVIIIILQKLLTVAIIMTMTMCIVRHVDVVNTTKTCTTITDIGIVAIVLSTVMNVKSMFLQMNAMKLIH